MFQDNSASDKNSQDSSDSSEVEEEEAETSLKQNLIDSAMNIPAALQVIQFIKIVFTCNLKVLNWLRFLSNFNSFKGYTIWGLSINDVTNVCDTFMTLCNYYCKPCLGVI